MIDRYDHWFDHLLVGLWFIPRPNACLTIHLNGQFDSNKDSRPVIFRLHVLSVINTQRITTSDHHFRLRVVRPPVCDLGVGVGGVSPKTLE